MLEGLYEHTWDGNEFCCVITNQKYYFTHWGGTGGLNCVSHLTEHLDSFELVLPKEFT